MSELDSKVCIFSPAVFSHTVCEGGVGVGRDLDLARVVLNV
jgi:hypothetical protein